MAEAQTIEALRQRFARIEGIEFKFSRPTYFTMQTPIEVEIYGYNLAKLKSVSDEIEGGLARVEGVKDVKSSMQVGNPELNIRFDRDRLSKFGLSLDQVSNRIKTKIQGDVPTKFKEREIQVDIRVRTTAYQAEDVGELRSLVIGEAVTVPRSCSAPWPISKWRGGSVRLPVYRNSGRRLCRATWPVATPCVRVARRCRVD